MKGMTFLRVTVNSRSVLVGSIGISTRELLEIPKDENGLVTVKRSIETDVETTGKISITMKLDTRGIGDPDDKSIGSRQSSAAKSRPSSSLPVGHSRPGSSISSAGGKRPSSNQQFNPKFSKHDVPFTIKIKRIVVTNLVSLHAIFSNSPVTHFNFGTMKKKTSIAKKKGANAEWNELDWLGHIFDEKSSFQMKVYSGSVNAGVLSLSIKELFALPPDKNGVSNVEGLLIKDESIRGRIKIFLELLPYVNSKTISIYFYLSLIFTSFHLSTNQYNR
jgi:hypothetical protein